MYANNRWCWCRLRFSDKYCNAYACRNIRIRKITLKFKQLSWTIANTWVRLSYDTFRQAMLPGIYSEIRWESQREKVSQYSENILGNSTCAVACPCRVSGVGCVMCMLFSVCSGSHSRSSMWSLPALYFPRQLIMLYFLVKRNIFIPLPQGK